MNKQRTRQEKGITLIALIITIVVLLILAVVAIRAVTGDGIIAKAIQAREDYEMAQIKEEAEMVKAEAIMEYNIKGETLIQDVLSDLINKHFEGSSKNENIVTTKDGKYDIMVDSNLNITVEKNGSTTAELNEYGFYFEQLYVAETEVEGMAFTGGYVFHEDGTAEFYNGSEEYFGCEDLFCIEAIESGITYSYKQISLDNGDGTQTVLTISEDGLSITGDGLTATCTFQELHGIYKGYTYSGIMEEEGSKLDVYVIVDANNIVTMKITEGEEVILNNSGNASYKGREHIIYVDDSTSPVFSVSVDGYSIIYDRVILTINENPADTPDDETSSNLEGAVITPVEGSSVEAIMAGNPTTGDTVEYNGYIYKYQKSFFLNQWVNNPDDVDFEGWGVRVVDTTLVSYPDMESNLFGVPVDNLYCTFLGCAELVAAPKLSSQAINMTMCFTGCSKLTTFNNIPSNVTSMNYAFQNCPLLTSVGAIPTKVTAMNYIFNQCTSLNGTIIINAKNLEDVPVGCFDDTVSAITLDGECPKETLEAIAAYYDNVTVKE